MIQMETEAKQIKEDAEGLMILTIGPDLDHRRANLITKAITMSRENIIAIKVQELIINKLVAIKAVQSSWVIVASNPTKMDISIKMVFIFQACPGRSFNLDNSQRCKLSILITYQQYMKVTRKIMQTQTEKSLWENMNMISGFKKSITLL